eukprot:g3511.t1
MGVGTASFATTVVAAAVLSVVSSQKAPSENGASRLAVQPRHLVQPENEQEHVYGRRVEQSPHKATGDGLNAATTGVPASFTIELGGHNWKPSGDAYRFIYVWIANQDQIFIAEVVDNDDGTLTATYESSFPGQYLVYIEEVEVERHDEGRPIAGSPFSLTITGAPTLDVDELPLCGANEDEDIKDSFWRPGTWLSSRLASSAHGVIRNGWVFQPRTCVHDTFTYEDLMLLASLEEETSILVVGGSIQRGIFLSLVDMALAQGQKDDFERSVLQKCWGYVSVRVGNLRLIYQDVVICNNEKLASGGSAEYVESCRQFLESTVFKSGTTWPAAILAPSNMERKREANFATKVTIGALPPDWTGKLMMVDHMSGYGFFWAPKNPTATSLEKAGMSFHTHPPLGDEELEQMRSYHGNDPRIEFVSAFPMYQAKLFENQHTKNGRRRYGLSMHYHHVSKYANSTETNGGQRMVQSTMMEMLANILISKAVGSKAKLQQRVEASPGIATRSAAIRSSFEVRREAYSIG